MKKLKLFFLMACVGLVTMYSCAEDEPKTVIDEEELVAPELTSPADGFSKVITEEDTDVEFTVQWSEADYGVDLAVNYNVEVVVTGDDFASASSLGSTTEASLSITYGELNSLLITEMEQAANEAVSLDLRVVSSASGQMEQMSAPITISITTFEDDGPAPQPEYPKLWVAGDFQGWDIANPDSIVSKEDNGIYEGYLYLPAGGTNEFKLYAQPAWEPDSYGTLEDSVVTKANYAGANFIAPSDGYYLFSVNMNDSTFFMMDTNWGLIGDATPGAWESSTEMAFDEATETWSVTTDLTVGALKFRANNAWTLDFGIDAEGELIYANHPAIGYVDRTAVTIAEAGNYTITLDLSIPGAYTYSVEMN